MSGAAPARLVRLRVPTPHRLLRFEFRHSPHKVDRVQRDGTAHVASVGRLWSVDYEALAGVDCVVCDLS